MYYMYTVCYIPLTILKTIMKTFIHLVRMCRAHHSSTTDLSLGTNGLYPTVVGLPTLYDIVDHQLSHCVACNISL